MVGSCLGYHITICRYQGLVIERTRLHPALTKPQLSSPATRDVYPATCHNRTEAGIILLSNDAWALSLPPFLLYDLSLNPSSIHFFFLSS